MNDLVGELRYLEKIVDFEDQTNRGAIAKKEILVYSPGKTGTTSLFHSIGAYCAKAFSWESYKNRLLHNHRNIALLKNIKSTSPEITDAFLEKRMIVKDLVEYKRNMGQKLLIVSSYREPISRYISNAFNIINNHLYISKTHSIEDYDYAACLKLLRKYLDISNTLHPIEEIEPDFFNKEIFDKENRYLLVDRGHYKILLLCLEHSDKWQDILSSQLGFDGIEILRSNQASKKDVSKMYDEFKERLRLPFSTIHDIYYDGPFAKYLKWFYTEEEIDDFFKESLAKYSDDTHCLSGPGTDRPQKRSLFSYKNNAATKAKAELLHCTWASVNRRYSITVKLTNSGDTIWLTGRPRRGTIALALRSNSANDGIITSNWCRLMEEIAPGQAIVMEADLEIPEGTEELDWKLEMVVKDIEWIPLFVTVSKNADNNCTDKPNMLKQ